MSRLAVFEDSPEKMPRWQDQSINQRDLGVQIVLSLALGLSAFIAFCVGTWTFGAMHPTEIHQILRPKWTTLYNARKKQSAAALRLPQLPKTMFGWVPVVYRISEEEVLASAGLEAYAACIRTWRQ